MKKNYLAILLILTIMFVSCSSNNNDVKTDDGIVINGWWKCTTENGLLLKLITEGFDGYHNGYVRWNDVHLYEIEWKKVGPNKISINTIVSGMRVELSNATISKFLGNKCLTETDIKTGKKLVYYENK